MPRPKCSRKIYNLPHCCRFDPDLPHPGPQREILVLELDELEAIRLADFDGLYHEQGAESMQISRQTFGRILVSARKKIATALVEGKSITIDGGEIMMTGSRLFKCSGCSHTWDVPRGTGRPECCPACKSSSFHRADVHRGGHGQGSGQNQGSCRRQGRKNN